MNFSPITAIRSLFGPPGEGFSRAGLAVMAIRVGAAGLALVAQVLAARLIGPEAFGQYALVLVWLVLLGHGSTLGTNQLVCRLLASYGAQGDRGAALGLLRFSLGLAGGASLVIAAVAIGLVQAGVGGISAEMAALATMGFFAIPLMTAQDFLEAIARGLDKPLLGIGPAIVLRHLAIIFGVGAVLVTGGSADAMVVMGFTIGGLVASVGLQYWLLRAQVRGALAGAKPVNHRGFWLKTALPVAMIDATETLFNNADILILGLLVSPEIVAFYFAATRLAQVLAYVPYGISAATAQKYAALAAQGERARLQILAARATRLGSALTGAGAVVLTLLAPVLLSLFGDGYGAAAGVVPLLALGLVLVCVMGPGEDVLTMLGQERACALAFALALAVNLGLNFALIPHWGMAGAATATVVALGVRGAGLAAFAYWRLGMVLPLGMGGGAIAKRQEAGA